MIRDLFKVLSTDLIIKIFTFVASVLVARSLGTDGRGELAIIISLTQLIAFVSIFGLDESIIYHAKKIDDNIFSYIIFIKLSFVLGLLSYLIGAFIVLNYYKNVDSIIYCYMLSIFFSIFLALLHSVLIGKEEFTIFNKSKLIQNLFYVLTAFILYALNVLDLALTLGVLVLSIIISIVFIYIKIADTYILNSKNNISIIDFVMRLNPYALKIFIYALAGSVVAQLPILYLASFVPKGDLGVFSVQLNIIYLIINIVSNALFVLMVKGHEKFELKYFFLMYFVYLFGLIFFNYFIADYFFTDIYGKAYAMSSEYFKSMTIGTFFWMGTNILNAILKGKGKVNGVMYITVCILLLFILQLSIFDKSIETLIRTYNISFTIGFILTLGFYIFSNNKEKIARLS